MRKKGQGYNSVVEHLPSMCAAVIQPAELQKESRPEEGKWATNQQ